MAKPLLHVLFSPSGAGTLRQTLTQQHRNDSVVCLHDDLSFGPVDCTDHAFRVRWIEDVLGVTEWDGVIAATPSFLSRSCSPDYMPVAWFSRRDTRSYTGFLWWLFHLEDRPCQIIDVTEVMIGIDLAADSPRRRAISPSVLETRDMALLLDTDIPLDQANRSHHQSHWQQLLRDNADLRVIDSEGSLVSAPITYFDPLILACADTDWMAMARLIGEALCESWNDDLHQTSDLFLHARACDLAEAGALEWRGDLSSMRACKVRRPANTGQQP